MKCCVFVGQSALVVRWMFCQLSAGLDKCYGFCSVAAFSRPLSRCDPCSIRPPLLHCFAYQRPGIGGISLHREIVHEQEPWEAVRDMSLERVDVSEECVGLYGDAI